MDVDFCLEVVEEAQAEHRLPAIFNTDQGSRFTSTALTGLLPENTIAISMGGRGPGATTFLSSGSGIRSNTKRSICGPTTVSPRRVLQSAGVWIFTTANVRIRALTPGQRIKLTSASRCGSMNFAAVIWVSWRKASPDRSDTPITASQHQPADVPLIESETLFRETRPPLDTRVASRMYSATLQSRPASGSRAGALERDFKVTVPPAP